jgi:nucleotide-binding universal stress UspA family protein
MKTVLLHLDEHDSLPSMMTTAFLVARRFGGHIEGYHVRAGVPRMVPAGPEGSAIATTELIESLEREERIISRRVRERFETFMREQQVPVTSSMTPSDQPTASWQETVSPDDEALASRGRVFDLIVVGRPISGATAPKMSTLEAALFESGRPILIAPPAAPEKIGETVVIAWNGSPETARTIAFAMPFLLQASDVLVLSVEEGMVPGPLGREVAQCLVRNGIAARSKNVQCGGRGAVGTTILAECGTLGADLLVKGAYTQSRLRQMIFGGATSHILGNAELPVLMAH